VEDSHCFLRGKAVPDPIAGNDEEVAVRGKFISLDLWVAGHSLQFLRFSLVLFVLKVTEGSRQVQHSVHSLLIHEHAGLLHSQFLRGQVGLMINTHVGGDLVDAKDTSGITSIGDDELSVSEDRDTGGASGIVTNVVHALSSLALAICLQFLASFLCLQQVIDKHEHFLQSFVEISILITLEFDKLYNEVVPCVLSDFIAYQLGLKELPPCPSNTPKTLMPPSKSRLAMCESS
jgi:hypothetical protein